MRRCHPYSNQTDGMAGKYVSNWLLRPCQSNWLLRPCQPCRSYQGKWVGRQSLLLSRLPHSSLHICHYAQDTRLFTHQTEIRNHVHTSWLYVKPAWIKKMYILYIYVKCTLIGVGGLRRKKKKRRNLNNFNFETQITVNENTKQARVSPASQSEPTPPSKTNKQRIKMRESKPIQAKITDKLKSWIQTVS